MARPIRITTAGLRELQGRMKRMEVALDPRQLTPILLDAVSLIRDRALLNLRSVTKTKTGALERSFVARPGKSERVASAWTKAGTKKAGSDARHAHLIEFGHRIVGHKPNKEDTGKSVKGRPFFRPAVDAMRAKVRRTIDDGIIRLLWDSVK